MKYIIALFYLLSTLPAHATLNDVDKQLIFSKNLLVNGGFENGKANWTPNDTADFTTTTTTPLEGGVNGLWDADASTDTLVTTAVTIPSGMYGRNGVASCLFVTASGTATHEIQAYDGSNVLSETTITSSTTPTRASTNFIFPSSGSVQLRIYANADEPEIEIDSCFLGPAEGYNVSNVSQAQFVGESYFAATTNCTWSRTNTAIGAFTADADCPGPTVVRSYLGSWQTTDSNLPRQTINNLPPGVYEITVFASISQSVAAANSITISDGTTTCVGAGGENSSSASSGQSYTCAFVYTDAGNRSFEIYGAAGSSTINIGGSSTGQNTTFVIRRFPTTQETAYTADKTANSWSGYHDNTCSWARTNTALGDPTADASCALVEVNNNSFGTVSTSGSVLPAITFTPSRAGRYFVCASVFATTASASTSTVRLWDGTTAIDVQSSTGASTYVSAYKLCGIYNATSVSAKTFSIQTATQTGSITLNSTVARGAVEWSIFQIDQSFPAPNLVNSVVSPSSGVEVIARAAIANPAGTPSITSQSGSWVSSLTDHGVGDISLNITAGTFSAAPTCTITNNDADDLGVRIDSASTSALRVGTFNAGSGARVETGFNVHCIGPK
jgi:hypothetical protein